MTICLSHSTALAYWRLHRYAAASPFNGSSPFGSSPPKASRARYANYRRKDLARLYELAELAERESLGKLHIAVTQGGSMPQSRVVSAHVYSEFPKESLCRAGNDLLVCSPEFCLAQLARDVSPIELALLGFELCGHYTLAPSFTSSIRYIDPITSGRKLVRFAQGLEGFHKAKSIRQTFGHVIDGSASPMESAVALLLCLPRRIGGYGIAHPVMNDEIQVPPHLHETIRLDRFIADLHWPDARLCLEYNSNAHHLTPEQAARDAGRSTALSLLGVELLPVTQKQLWSVDEFHKVAVYVAKRTGTRLECGAYDFQARRAELRRMLFGALRDSRPANQATGQSPRR